MTSRQQVRYIHLYKYNAIHIIYHLLKSCLQYQWSTIYVYSPDNLVGNMSTEEFMNFKSSKSAKNFFASSLRLGFEAAFDRASKLKGKFADTFSVRELNACESKPLFDAVASLGMAGTESVPRLSRSNSFKEAKSTINKS